GRRPHGWLTLGSGTMILLISMGSMATIGLYVAPIHHSTGWSLTLISLAIATAQLVSGVMQSVFGVLADARGTAPVLVTGCALITVGLIATAAVGHGGLLVLTLGVVCASGWGASTYSVVSGAVARQIDPGRRSFAFGLLNSGNSAGQLLFAPVLTLLIGALGWAGALRVEAAIALLILPLALLFRGAGRTDQPRAALWSIQGEVAQQVKAAYRDRSFLLLSAAFVTCGFHVAFLAAHYPNAINLHGHGSMVSGAAMTIVGACNIAGCLTVGALGTRWRLKSILICLYAARAVIVVAFLLSDQSTQAFFITAAALGVSWAATVGPTNGLIDKHFGARFLSTLMGLTMLAHQIGAFLGAWLAGVIVTATGSYTPVFILDAALAVGAALAMAGVHEPKARTQAAASK
ncbi:MAG: MFS transporter, partial [Propionibacteriaceae bacterium]|nr:MFS transporter [Propionibacteriaceae bacterium]